MINILTVCLGNICRSPAAETLLRTKLEKLGIEAYVDSAGTIDLHAGDKADKRMREAAANRGIEIHSISRQFHINDFEAFDFIIAMDDSNYRDIVAMTSREEETAKVVKMIDFASDKYASLGKVPDPYFGGDEGFDQVLDLLDDACEGFIAQKLSK